MSIPFQNYVLYGAASIGNIAKKTLEEAGLNVIGYIDKRAYEIQIFNNLPVWSLDTFPQDYCKSDIAVFISVKNVFEHEQIAAALHRSGFTHIVYKPYSVLLGYGNRQEDIINKIYDDMFAGKYNNKYGIPICPIGTKRNIHDFALICEDTESITANIPLEFVYTNDYHDSGMAKWGNICILALFTHIDFFSFLNNDKASSPADYLQEYCIYTANLQKTIKITEAWKINVVQNRMQIYEQMKDALDLDPDFFVRNAAEARWNTQKKYFNLISGKHRCAFQAAIGKKYIPLKISKCDYEEFINKSEVNETIRILYENEEKLLIPHPYFYHSMLSEDRGDFHFFTWFARYYGRATYFRYGRVNFGKIRILDWSKDFGNFARFCVRMGCFVQRILTPKALEIQLNNLLYSAPVYHKELSNVSGNIVVVESEQLEYIDSALLNSKNSWIVRNTELDKIEQFAARNCLCIAEKICESYRSGIIVWSCLLEPK